jgi:soluble lytic murein transglycosylase-like protein
LSHNIKIIKYIFYWIVFSYFLFTYSTVPLHSEIKKTVTEDGTVQYYNVPPVQQSAKKHDFKSRYNGFIESISMAEGVDPYLVKCIIRVESNFSADAVSVAGAMGLMQIMQDIARYYNVKNPFDPEENLTAGIKHFKSLLVYFKNDVPLSLAAYHAGIGRVRKNMQIPPIQATVDYVNSVMSFYSGGSENNLEKVKKLYKRINSEGVIEIYNK